MRVGLRLFLFFWQSTFPLTKIDVQGLSRLTPGSVLKTVGLKAGTQVGKTELDRACQKLIGSGLFEGCNWKYAGGAVTLELKEAPAEQTVHLSVPGVDECVVYTKYALPPGDHELMLSITDLARALEVGRRPATTPQ